MNCAPLKNQQLNLIYIKTFSITAAYVKDLFLRDSNMESAQICSSLFSPFSLHIFCCAELKGQFILAGYQADLS